MAIVPQTALPMVSASAAVYDRSIERWRRGTVISPLSSNRAVSEHDADVVGAGGVAQRDVSGNGRAIELDGPHAAIHPIGILDHDTELRAAGPQRRFVARPMTRNARIDVQCSLLQRQPDQRFNSNAVHPGRRARIPRPAASP